MNTNKRHILNQEKLKESIEIVRARVCVFVCLCVCVCVCVCVLNCVYSFHNKVYEYT